MGYHRAVLLQQAVACLQLDSCGVYVDATCGGGGHACSIAAHLEGGHLYAFDQDPDSVAHMEEVISGGGLRADVFTMVADNFRNMTVALRQRGIVRVHGILADLGMSTHQIRAPHRGFSMQREARWICAWRLTSL